MTQLGATHVDLIDFLYGALKGRGEVRESILMDEFGYTAGYIHGKASRTNPTDHPDPLGSPTPMARLLADTRAGLAYSTERPSGSMITRTAPFISMEYFADLKLSRLLLLVNFCNFAIGRIQSGEEVIRAHTFEDEATTMSFYVCKTNDTKLSGYWNYFIGARSKLIEARKLKPGPTLLYCMDEEAFRFIPSPLPYLSLPEITLSRWERPPRPPGHFPPDTAPFVIRTIDLSPST